MLYREVVQAVLLFGSESWVLLTSMERMVEGTQTGFLRQIIGNHERRRTDGTWVAPAAEEVWESAGTQLASTYICRRQRRWINGWRCT